MAVWILIKIHVSVLRLAVSEATFCNVLISWIVTFGQHAKFVRCASS